MPLTFLKPTKWQNTFQTDPACGSGAGRPESVVRQHACQHVASWSTFKWHDMHAVSDASGRHVSGILCILYKETFSVIQLGITLERPTPKRWWKLSFLNID